MVLLKERFFVENVIHVFEKEISKRRKKKCKITRHTKRKSHIRPRVNKTLFMLDSTEYEI